MGIINMSPDSFSGDGQLEVDGALKLAQQMVEQGVDIIDIGGESTRPGAVPVDPDEEISRIVPLIERLKKRIDIPLSVDTYKKPVAEKALEAGVDMLNDISGMLQGMDLIMVAAENKVPIVITSNHRGNEVGKIMESVIGQLRKMIDYALRMGVKQDDIIIDPGIGFGKTVEQNLEIIRKLDKLKILHRPILLGTSRKSFIGTVLGTPPEDRLAGTAATIAIGISKGANIIRVHDVKQMKLVAMMSDAVVKGLIKL
jgi:dihydropteroate synthase